MSKPCRIQNDRLAAIYDVIKRLNEENGVNTLKGIFQWFNENYGTTISQDEIMDSLVATSPKKIKGAVRDFKDAIDRIRMEKDYLQQIDDLVIEGIGSSAETASVAKMTKINNMVRRLFDAFGKNHEVTHSDGMTGRLSLEEIQQTYQDLFSTNPDHRERAAQTIRTKLDALKSILRVKDLETRVADYKKRIANLESDDVDVNNLLNPVTAIPTRYTDAVIEKESQLAELKNEIEKYMVKRRIEEKAKKYGLLGFKGPKAVRARVNLSLAFNESWEVTRTMKFFFDASVMATQLAPVVIPDMVGINIGKETRDLAMQGDFKKAIVNVFSSQKKLVGVLRDQLWKVFADDIVATSKEGSLWAAKRARGKEILRQTKEIMTDPLFGIARRMGLRISESRSLSGSEEMFHSTVLNRMKVLGLIKDVSEDLMVAPLNKYRFSLFKEFYLANPGIPESELMKATHFINELTGTSHINTGVAGFVFSAPRLLLSRLHLAFFRPVGLIGALDIPGTVKNPLGGIKYQTAADQFIANQLYRMWSGYAKMFALIAGIAALRNDDIDWPDFKKEVKEGLLSPFDADWLRIKGKHIKYDYTG